MFLKKVVKVNDYNDNSFACTQRLLLIAYLIFGT